MDINITTEIIQTFIEINLKTNINKRSKCDIT